MFGNNNMQEMMAKLQDMQGAVEESKLKMEKIFVKGVSEDGKIRFVMNGNRVVKDVKVDDSLLNVDAKETLEQDLADAFNDAIKNANSINEGEMKNTAMGMFPGMGM